MFCEITYNMKIVPENNTKYPRKMKFRKYIQCKSYVDLLVEN